MQPLIIFGTRQRMSDVNSGKFYCPNCSVERGDERQYVRKNIRNYFSLYFVPLIPLGSGEDYIECQNCGMAFQPDVLDIKFKPKRRVLPLAQQLNTLTERLEDGFPVEYAIADLTAAGLERELALDSVRRAIGTLRRQCPECGLTYAPNVASCKEDDTPLEDVR